MRKVRNTSPLFEIGLPKYAAVVHTQSQEKQMWEEETREHKNI